MQELKEDLNSVEGSHNAQRRGLVDSSCTLYNTVDVV